MPQYRIGTVTVSASQIVTGSGTSWLSAGLLPGDPFIVTTDGVPYYIANVDTDLQLSLSAPYAGTPASGLAYVAGGQFTPNLNLPYHERNDIEIAATMKRACLIMDSLDLSFTYYAWASDDAGADFTTTFDPLLDYQAILRSPTEIAVPVVGDFVGLWRYVRGAQGVMGNPGAESELFTYSATTTDADPGAGAIRFNNAALASATQAFIDLTNAGGADVAAWLDSLADSTSSNKAILRVSKNSAGAANYASFYVTAVISATGYRKLALTYIGGAGTLDTTTADTVVAIGRVGDKGDIGLTGPAWDQWKSAWVNTTDYVALDAVSNGGSSYIATAASGPATSVIEPGVTSGWESYWDVQAAKGADGAGVGDVVGPAASVDGELAQFSGITGKLLKRYSASGLLKSVAGVISAVVSGTDIKTINGESILGSGDIALSSANAENLTHLIHPTLDGNFRDTYCAGALPAWLNQQWGGAQWGGLPDGSLGGVATGNIQDDAIFNLGNGAGNTYIATGFVVSESENSPPGWLKVYKVGNPTDNLVAEISASSGGLPASLVGSPTSVSGKQITSNINGAWLSLDIPSGVLNSNTQYHITLSRSGAIDANNYYVVKGTTNRKYPHGLGVQLWNTTWSLMSAAYGLCFLIQNAAANSLIQSGGMFGNYKLAFNNGSPINQSRSLAQPLSQFYDGKECSVIHRGTYAVSSNVWDFAYGLDHDRITVTVNASGYPVLSIYEADRTLAQVTGASSITTGDHDVAIKVRTVGDGADYAHLFVDGVSVGTPLTTQTFTMSKEMRELGTARLGDGFGIIPAWTQDMQMTSLPSAQGWTWMGTGTEANCMSVSGGKLYQNANGYASESGYYSKVTTLNNTTGWGVKFKVQVPKHPNTVASPAVNVNVYDGTKTIIISISEYFISVYGTAWQEGLVQDDFRSKPHTFVLQGKGSDYYLFMDGKLIIDGTGSLLATSTSNKIFFGDGTSAAGLNADAIWSYVKYYQGGMILPIANNKDCSEFAHWSGDKSALFAPLWNAGSPVSVKELCGVEKNHIGEGVVQKEVRLGITSSAHTAVGTDVLIAEQEAYIIGSSIDYTHRASPYSTQAAGNNVRLDGYIDGVQVSQAHYHTPVSGYAEGLVAIGSTPVVLGLHKVEARSYQSAAGTISCSSPTRNTIIEARS